MLNVWKYQNQKQVNFALDNVTVQFQNATFCSVYGFIKNEYEIRELIIRWNRQKISFSTILCRSVY